MSNYLTGLSQLNPQVKRHNGSTATLTLDENGTTNATLLFVNGVAQTPGIDFNVSGATLTCTSTLPAGTNIATTIQYFNTGIVNTVSDDAIGLGQMASGTDGNLITYDASGNPAHVATGSDGQVLTSAGAGAAPAFEALPAGSGWEFLSKITCSTSSTIDVTSLITANYDYKITAYGIDLSADSYLRCTFSSDNNSSQITSAYYSGGGNLGSGTWYTTNLAYGSLMYTGTVMDEANGEVFFDMTLYNPMDSSNQTTLFAIVGSANTSNQSKLSNAYTEQRSDTAVNAIRIYPSTGSFNTGEVFIYRRPNT